VGGKPPDAAARRPCAGPAHPLPQTGRAATDARAQAVPSMGASDRPGPGRSTLRPGTSHHGAHTRRATTSDSSCSPLLSLPLLEGVAVLAAPRRDRRRQGSSVRCSSCRARKGTGPRNERRGAREPVPPRSGRRASRAATWRIRQEPEVIRPSGHRRDWPDEGNRDLSQDRGTKGDRVQRRRRRPWSALPACPAGETHGSSTARGAFAHRNPWRPVPGLRQWSRRLSLLARRR